MKNFCSLFLSAVFLFFNLASGARADALDNWTTNQITTNQYGCHHIVYGNGIFVMVTHGSDYGQFYTSVDGRNWKRQYSEPNSWNVTLNYSGGRFAGACQGLGSGVVDVSADGTNWTTTFFQNNGLPAFDAKAAIYGNGLYVAVGSTNGVGSIFTSPDGVTWTFQSAGSIRNGPGGPIRSVAYGAGRFVAVGTDGLEYSSLTGTGTWSRTSYAGNGVISFVNGLFISPLNNKTNLVSTDGVNWSSLATGLTNQLGFVTYGNGVFLSQCGIARPGSYLATSADGTNWFQYPQLLPNACAIFDTSDFDVSVATDGKRLLTCGSVLTPGFTYNGFVYVSDPLVGMRITNSPSRKVALSGLVGRNYQIQSTDALGAGSNWRTNATLQLTNTPYLWTDATATNSARFYRGVLLP